jgi:4-amino-4-deoxy-L-arabinose transferase-like glycosyltransferase
VAQTTKDLHEQCKGQSEEAPSRTGFGQRAGAPIRRVTRFWRSPPGQPSWARPTLLAIAAVAALSYAWGIGSVNLEPLYGSAARSMSESWSNWFFGAADPWGTVSLDKLPGAIWVQALSLRQFGFHLWAIVLPQVIEGTLTVLVLYRAVRRMAGPGAGLVAAAVLAVSPITVLLNRANISDSLLILLLVLAADATSRALISGRVQSLMMAGVWVGLAFQTKMLQSWLVLPALYLAYLVAAPAASFLRRFGHVALSALVVIVVSLSYMTAVTAVPAQDRPYVDGSCDNSIFGQVFLYNGLNRFFGTELSQAGCSKPWSYQTAAFEEALAPGLNAVTVPPGWNRLLIGVFGRNDAWVVVPSVVAAGFLLLRRRRRDGEPVPRTDPVRAAALMWTTWLLVTGVFFSVGHYLLPYYVAALAPPMAALCGMGFSLAWRRRHHTLTRVVMGVVVAASCAYSLWLLPSSFGVRTPVVVSMLVAAVVTVVVVAWSCIGSPPPSWSVQAAIIVGSATLLVGSGWASGTAVATGLGPFDSPYEPSSVVYQSQIRPALQRQTWPILNSRIANLPVNVSAEAIEGSALAGYLIMTTGREYLPVGGFSGRVPVPALARFIHYVREGRVGLVDVAVAPLTDNPDMRWVVAHCTRFTGGGSTYVSLGTRFQLYLCSSYQANGNNGNDEGG